MEVLTYVSCMDTAYVRGNPPPKKPYEVQYLHFRAWNFGWLYLDTLPKTNMTMEKHLIFNRRYIFIHGVFSIVMLVFEGVPIFNIK